jgi:hypothetical protein
MSGGSGSGWRLTRVGGQHADGDRLADGHGVAPARPRLCDIAMPRWSRCSSRLYQVDRWGSSDHGAGRNRGSLGG